MVASKVVASKVVLGTEWPVKNVVQRQEFGGKVEWVVLLGWCNGSIQSSSAYRTKREAMAEFEARGVGGPARYAVINSALVTADERSRYAGTVDSLHVTRDEAEAEVVRCRKEFKKRRTPDSYFNLEVVKLEEGYAPKVGAWVKWADVDLDAEEREVVKLEEA